MFRSCKKVKVPSGFSRGTQVDVRVILLILSTREKKSVIVDFESRLPRYLDALSLVSPEERARLSERWISLWIFWKFHCERQPSVKFLVTSSRARAYFQAAACTYARG